MAKKDKIKPAILHTREGMEAEITDYLRLQLKHKALTAEMEAEKLAVEKRFQDRLNGLGRDIEAKFAAVQNFCVLHRPELLTGDKKSFETVNATVRFYFTPFSVEKRGKETFGALAKRLLGLVFTDKNQVVLDCAQFVRDPEPELDKNALLAARANLTEEQLKAMGLRFGQEEIFAIEPKSELLDADTGALKEAA